MSLKIPWVQRCPMVGATNVPPWTKFAALEHNRSSAAALSETVVGGLIERCVRLRVMFVVLDSMVQPLDVSTAAMRESLAAQTTRAIRIVSAKLMVVAAFIIRQRRALWG